MDKIILGEKYGFDEWVAPALADLFAREEDLTLEEGERLGVKAIIAIAKGRLQVREVVCVRPMQYAQDLATQLYPVTTLPVHEMPVSSVGDHTPNESDESDESHEPTPSPTSPVALYSEEEINLERNELIKELMDDSSAIDGLVRFLAQNPIQAPLVVSDALHRLWVHHEQFWKTCIQKTPVPFYVGREDRALAAIRRAMSTSEFDALVKSFCLDKIENLDDLLHPALVSPDSNTFSIWWRYRSSSRLPDTFVNLVTRTRFVQYVILLNLVDKKVLNRTIFDKFWEKMEQLFRVIWKAAIPRLNSRLETVLEVFGMAEPMKGPAMAEFYKRCEELVDTDRAEWHEGINYNSIYGELVCEVCELSVNL
jgi:hypothetical protein